MNKRHLINRRQFLQMTAVGGVAFVATSLPSYLHLLAQSEAIPVTFWTPGGDPAFCTNFDTISLDFEQLNPLIDVLKTQCGVGEQNFNEVLLARIAAGNPPDSTILWTSPVALGARGALAAIDDLMAASQYSQLENWPAGLLASCQFGGKTYGLPVTSGSYAMWFNKTMFEEKGIALTRDTFPKTWDELRRLSKEITTWNGDVLEKVGFMPLASDMQEMPIWSGLNGSQLYDATNQKYTINSDQNIEMMEYALSWLEEEYRGNMTLVNQSGNWKAGIVNGVDPAIASQRQAVVTVGSWDMGSPRHADSSFEWDVASFPVGPSGSKTAAGFWPNWVVVPQNAQHPTEAFKWLDYLGGVGVIPWFAKFPDLPVNKQATGDLSIPSLEKGKGAEFAVDVLNFYRGQFDVSVPMWNSPVEDFATDQITRAYDAILNKTASPKDALGEAQIACENELKATLSM